MPSGYAFLKKHSQIWAPKKLSSSNNLRFLSISRNYWSLENIRCCQWSGSQRQPPPTYFPFSTPGVKSIFFRPLLQRRKGLDSAGILAKVWYALEGDFCLFPWSNSRSDQTTTREIHPQKIFIHRPFCFFAWLSFSLAVMLHDHYMVKS